RTGAAASRSSPGAARARAQREEGSAERSGPARGRHNSATALLAGRLLPARARRRPRDAGRRSTAPRGRATAGHSGSKSPRRYHPHARPAKEASFPRLQRAERYGGDWDAGPLGSCSPNEQRAADRRERKGLRFPSGSAAPLWPLSHAIGWRPEPGLAPRPVTQSESKMADAGAGSLHGGDSGLSCPPEEQELSQRLRRLYPAVNQEETPLPRSWSPKDKYNYIGLSQGNLRVHYKGHGKNHKDAASVRATHPIPAACGIYYFEVKIVSKGRDGSGHSDC
uniref:RAN binding protein 10 n=1 Tax=Apteryx owenii TaxID=8824 RepID=A0A8B9SBW1_APTOW